MMEKVGRLPVTGSRNKAKRNSTEKVVKKGKKKTAFSDDEEYFFLLGASSTADILSRKRKNKVGHYIDVLRNLSPLYTLGVSLWCNG